MTVVPPDLDFWGVAPVPGRLDYRSGTAYRARKDEVMEALISRAADVLPGLADHIVLREASTPITHERFTGATGGTGYGLELSADQVGLRRPGPATQIGGLFLVGASTRWCHGVMGVMNGGVGTAGAVLGRDLRREVLGGRVFGDTARLPADGSVWDPLVASRGDSRVTPRTTPRSADAPRRRLPDLRRAAATGDRVADVDVHGHHHLRLVLPHRTQHGLAVLRAERRRLLGAGWWSWSLTGGRPQINAGKTPSNPRSPMFRIMR